MEKEQNMQATSFQSDKRGGVHHFYATVIRGEVSDAAIEGYLRAASQIEDLWQQIDEKVATLIAQGTPPWEAYAQVGSPLAFIRSSRAYQVFVKELLAADVTFEPQTVGYLPPITYEQANALSHQMLSALQDAVATFSDPAYVPAIPLPLIFGPRIENEGRPCPTSHLQGNLAAAREVREWVAGLIAQYSNAVQQAKAPVPAEISAHVTTLQGRLAQADSQLRMGVDLAGQVSQGEATPEMHMEVEDVLWNALQSFFLLNQAVAKPELLHPNQARLAETRQGLSSKIYQNLSIRPDDLWRVSVPSARNELRGTEFGSREMEELWQRIGGVLSAGAQQYLDETNAAVARGDIYASAAMADCPYEPIYRTRRSLDIAGSSVPADYEFHWNFHQGHVESSQRFGRTDNWQKC
jgi:hypothetical protein